MSAAHEAAAFRYYPLERDKGDSPYHTLSDRFVTVRREYRCHICGALIRPGERARCIREFVEGDGFSTERFCWTCCEAMAAVWDDGGDALEERWRLFWEGGSNA
jgi:hypothetical protein